MKTKKPKNVKTSPKLLGIIFSTLIFSLNPPQAQSQNTPSSRTIDCAELSRENLKTEKIYRLLFSKDLRKQERAGVILYKESKNSVWSFYSQSAVLTQNNEPPSLYPLQYTIYHPKKVNWDSTQNKDQCFVYTLSVERFSITSNVQKQNDQGATIERFETAIQNPKARELGCEQPSPLPRGTRTSLICSLF